MSELFIVKTGISASENREVFLQHDVSESWKTKSWSVLLSQMNAIHQVQTAIKAVKLHYLLYEGHRVAALLTAKWSQAIVHTLNRVHSLNWMHLHLSGCAEFVPLQKYQN